MTGGKRDGEGDSSGGDDGPPVPFPRMSGLEFSHTTRDSERGEREGSRTLVFDDLPAQSGARMDELAARRFVRSVERVLSLDGADENALMQVLGRNSRATFGANDIGDLVAGFRELLTTALCGLLGDRRAEQALRGAIRGLHSSHERARPEGVMFRRVQLMLSLGSSLVHVDTWWTLPRLLLTLDPSLTDRETTDSLASVLNELRPSLLEARTLERASAIVTTRLNIFGDAARTEAGARKQNDSARRDAPKAAQEPIRAYAEWRKHALRTKRGSSP